MTTQTVTLTLPASLYERLRERAKQSHRTVEAEALDVLLGSLSPEDVLAPELAEVIGALEALDDNALWNAARSRFPDEAADELEDLQWKRQDDGLTEAERDRAGTLRREQERVMLVRAQAALLLKRRGYDVSSLALPA